MGRRGLTAILKGTRSTTADRAIRLARYYNMPRQSWLNLRKNDEREVAKRTTGRTVEADGVDPALATPAVI
jgi:plasmid maintenance system antidote protein VapI